MAVPRLGGLLPVLAVLLGLLRQSTPVASARPRDSIVSWFRASRAPGYASSFTPFDGPAQPLAMTAAPNGRVFTLGAYTIRPPPAPGTPYRPDFSHPNFTVVREMWRTADGGGGAGGSAGTTWPAWLGGGAWERLVLPDRALRLQGSTGVVIPPQAAGADAAVASRAAYLLCTIGGRLRTPDGRAYLPTTAVTCSASGGGQWEDHAPLPFPLVGASLLNCPAGMFLVGGAIVLGAGDATGRYDGSGTGGIRASDFAATYPSLPPLPWSGVLQAVWSGTGAAARIVSWTVSANSTLPGTLVYPAVTWSYTRGGAFITGGAVPAMDDWPTATSPGTALAFPNARSYVVAGARWGDRASWTLWLEMALWDRTSYPELLEPEWGAVEVVRLPELRVVPVVATTVTLPGTQDSAAAIAPLNLPLPPDATMRMMINHNGLSTFIDLEHATLQVNLDNVVWPDLGLAQVRVRAVTLTATTEFRARNTTSTSPGSDSTAATPGTTLQLDWNATVVVLGTSLDTSRGTSLVPQGVAQGEFMRAFPGTPCEAPCFGQPGRVSDGCRVHPYDGTCHTCGARRTDTCTPGETFELVGCGEEVDSYNHPQPAQCRPCTVCRQRGLATLSLCAYKNDSVCGVAPPPAPLDPALARYYVLPATLAWAELGLVLAACAAVAVSALLSASASGKGGRSAEGSTWHVWAAAFTRPGSGAHHALHPLEARAAALVAVSVASMAGGLQQSLTGAYVALTTAAVAKAAPPSAASPDPALVTAGLAVAVPVATSFAVAAITSAVANHAAWSRRARAMKEAADGGGDADPSGDSSPSSGGGSTWDMPAPTALEGLACMQAPLRAVLPVVLLCPRTTVSLLLHANKALQTDVNASPAQRFALVSALSASIGWAKAWLLLRDVPACLASLGLLIMSPATAAPGTDASRSPTGFSSGPPASEQAYMAAALTVTFLYSTASLIATASVIRAASSRLPVLKFTVQGDSWGPSSGTTGRGGAADTARMGILVGEVGRHMSPTDPLGPSSLSVSVSNPVAKARQHIQQGEGWYLGQPLPSQMPAGHEEDWDAAGVGTGVGAGVSAVGPSPFATSNSSSAFPPQPSSSSPLHERRNRVKVAATTAVTESMAGQSCSGQADALRQPHDLHQHQNSTPGGGSSDNQGARLQRPALSPQPNEREDSPSSIPAEGRWLLRRDGSWAIDTGGEQGEGIRGSHPSYPANQLWHAQQHGHPQDHPSSKAAPASAAAATRQTHAPPAADALASALAHHVRSILQSAELQDEEQHRARAALEQLHASNAASAAATGLNRPAAAAAAAASGGPGPRAGAGADYTDDREPRPAGGGSASGAAAAAARIDFPLTSSAAGGAALHTSTEARAAPPQQQRPALWRDAAAARAAVATLPTFHRLQPRQYQLPVYSSDSATGSSSSSSSSSSPGSSVGNGGGLQSYPPSEPDAVAPDANLPLPAAAATSAAASVCGPCVHGDPISHQEDSATTPGP